MLSLYGGAIYCEEAKAGAITFVAGKKIMCGRYDGVLKMGSFKPIDVECIENFRHFLWVSISQFYMALHNVTWQKFQKEPVGLCVCLEKYSDFSFIVALNL